MKAHKSEPEPKLPQQKKKNVFLKSNEIRT